MKTEFDSLNTPRHVRRLRFGGGTAPSLRVPVTAENRELLRWLRATEMSEWERPHTKPRRSFRIRLSRFSCPPLFRLNINKA